jgi:hypothetical protein
MSIHINRQTSHTYSLIQSSIHIAAYHYSYQQATCPNHVNVQVSQNLDFVSHYTITFIFFFI